MRPVPAAKLSRAATRPLRTGAPVLASLCSAEVGRSAVWAVVGVLGTGSVTRTGGLLMTFGVDSLGVGTVWMVTGGSDSVGGVELGVLDGTSGASVQPVCAGFERPT